ncbi:MAG: hypothetical protein IT160_01540 [Bryobacterales bacterium]|nr:hypothetical protein [Bryobacterales bacterium]
MKKLITAVLCLGTALAAGAASDSAKPANAQAAPKTGAYKTDRADPMLARLPAGAKLVSPNTWEYTDPQGKKWIYRRTPFTLAKLAVADHPEYDRETVVDRRAVDMATATDKGDAIEFTRPGPFGLLKWTTRKSDLSAYERRVWERYQGKKADAAPRGAAAGGQE